MFLSKQNQIIWLFTFKDKIQIFLKTKILEKLKKKFDF